MPILFATAAAVDKYRKDLDLCVSSLARSPSLFIQILSCGNSHA